MVQTIFRTLQLRPVVLCLSLKVTSMFHQLGWQKLATHHYNSHLFFLFKIIHNLICVSLSDITNIHHIIKIHHHEYITREECYSSIYKQQYSFGPSVCNNWNNLLSYIKETTSIEHFKNQINQL